MREKRKKFILDEIKDKKVFVIQNCANSFNRTKDIKMPVSKVLMMHQIGVRYLA